MGERRSGIIVMGDWNGDLIGVWGVERVDVEWICGVWYVGMRCPRIGGVGVYRSGGVCVWEGIGARPVQGERAGVRGLFLGVAGGVSTSDG